MKKFILVLLVVFCWSGLQAQAFTKVEAEKVVRENLDLDGISSFKTEELDYETWHANISKVDEADGLSTIGYGHVVNLDLVENSTLHETSNGFKSYRLLVNSEGAERLNLYFASVNLPKDHFL